MDWLMNQILGWLTSALTSSFDAMFGLIAHTLLHTPDPTSLPQVTAMTGRAAWVVDTVFVLAFLAVGVITMTTGGAELPRYTVKELLPRLVVGFIAAHFAPLLVTHAIDLANGLVTALYGSDRDISDQAAAIRQHIIRAGQDKSTTFLFMIILAVVTVLVATTAFGLIVRLSLLLVLTAVCPLALACHALPATDGLARLWWRSFAGCLAIPVLQAFTLQAGVAMFLDQSNLLPTIGIPIGGDSAELVNLLVVVVILWTTVRIPGLVSKHVTRSGQTNIAGLVVRMVLVQRLSRLLRIRHHRRAATTTAAADATAAGGRSAATTMIPYWRPRMPQPTPASVRPARTTGGATPAAALGPSSAALARATPSPSGQAAGSRPAGSRPRVPAGVTPATAMPPRRPSWQAYGARPSGTGWPDPPPTRTPLPAGARPTGTGWAGRPASSSRDPRYPTTGARRGR
jgi:hypothetical protein